MTADLIGRVQADALADAGINLGIFELIKPGGRGKPDTGDGGFLVQFDEGEIEVFVTPENARIDLNIAPPELIQGLFEVTGNDVDARMLADVVLDWRDQDNERLPYGAEDNDYSSAGLQYGARDGPFLTTSELSQVMGMTEGVLNNLRDRVTVYSGSTQVDPYTAAREVLLAVPDLAPADIDKFLAARRSPDSRGEAHLYLRGTERYLAGSPSRVYTITANARTTGGAVASLEAIIRLTGIVNDEYEIISWSRPFGPDQPAADSEVVNTLKNRS